MFISEVKKLWHGGLHNLLMFRQIAAEGARKNPGVCSQRESKIAGQLGGRPGSTALEDGKRRGWEVGEGATRRLVRPGERGCMGNYGLGMWRRKGEGGNTRGRVSERRLGAV